MLTACDAAGSASCNTPKPNPSSSPKAYGAQDPGTKAMTAKLAGVKVRGQGMKGHGSGVEGQRGRGWPMC